MRSPEVLTALQECGWRAGRKTDTARWISDLAKYGVVAQPAGVQVMEEFGGLEISPRKSSEDTHLMGRILFDPLKGLEPDRVLDWSDVLGIKLTPVGFIYPDTTLLISEKGEVFGEWSGVLHWYGVDIDDALEHTLVFATRVPKLFAEHGSE